MMRQQVVILLVLVLVAATKSKYHVEYGTGPEGDNINNGKNKNLEETLLPGNRIYEAIGSNETVNTKSIAGLAKAAIKGVKSLFPKKSSVPKETIPPKQFNNGPNANEHRMYEAIGSNETVNPRSLGRIAKEIIKDVISVIPRTYSSPNVNNVNDKSNNVLFTDTGNGNDED